MKIRKAAFIGLIISLAASPVWSESGKTGVAFLSLGNGARAVGMGEAQTALAEASNAIYWNPAGLSLTGTKELTVTHVQHFEDSTQQYAGFAIPLKKGERGGLGISFTRFAVDEIESRDATSALLGTVEQEDTSLQVSYGFKVFGRKNDLSRSGLRLGLGLKRISEKLAGVSDSTFSGDLGFQYRADSRLAEKWGQWLRRMSFGGAVLNAGSGLTFDQEETELPQSTKLGFGYTHFLWGDALNLGLDLRFPKGEDSEINGGGEFWIKNAFAMRLGFVGGQDIGDSVRAGAGFRFKNMQIDYAWAGFGDELGDTHRFSVLFRFGEGAVVREGLKDDLLEFYMLEAQEALSAGSVHEAILNANQVLGIDSRYPQALQILFEAGEKLNPPSPLPETSESAVEEGEAE